MGLAVLTRVFVGCVASRFGITGGTLAPVVACATGTHAIIRAAQMIADGDADLVLCGGADASVCRLWMAAYEQMGVLAKPHPDRGPDLEVRVWDDPGSRCSW